MSDWGLGFRVPTPGVDAHPKALTRLDDQRLRGAEREGAVLGGFGVLEVPDAR